MAATCPFCHSNDLAVVPRAKRPDVFLPRAPRKCNACKTTYVSPFPPFVRFIILLTGIAVITFGVMAIIVPALQTWFSDGAISVRTILNLLLYTWAFFYMAWFSYIAGMTREPLRL